jgi:hypothetical protein
MIGQTTVNVKLGRARILAAMPTMALLCGSPALTSTRLDFTAGSQARSVDFLRALCPSPL